jgi:hypothetical protein
MFEGTSQYGAVVNQMLVFADCVTSPLPPNRRYVMKLGLLSRNYENVFEEYEDKQKVLREIKEGNYIPQDLVNDVFDAMTGGQPIIT